jgi:DNA polymerase-3 subunit epsilon
MSLSAARRTSYLYLAAGGIFIYASIFSCAYLLLLFQADNPPLYTQIYLALTLTTCITAAIMIAMFIALRVLVFRPLEILDREARILASINPGHVIELPGSHLLGELPKTISDLGDAFIRAKRETAESVSAISNDIENSKIHLETILMTLREGVIVCDERARIMFYNPAARSVFHENDALGLGRSLYLLCLAAPIENALALLRQRRIRHPEGYDTENDVSFMCSTLQGALINCRVHLLPFVPGLSWSFLFTCEDISREADAGERRENLLRMTIKRMRGPLTSIGLGAESLEMLPDLDAVNRAAMERTIVHEARNLIEQFEVLAREIQELESSRYLVNDIFSEDLAACVARRLEERGIHLTMIGSPLWVKADIHSLLFLLEFFAVKIRGHIGVDILELETLLGDRHVYFNYYWEGAEVPQAEIGKWTSCVPETSASHTVAEVLEHIGSEVWSKPHQTPGFAVLCFPVPSSPSQWDPPIPLLPARPVYTDFVSGDDAAETALLKDTSLDSISFVVFDTETTGLAPLGGDEIISLAGVKIINMGIIVGETFDRLVDPRRSIPQSSIRFHGITDEMVRGMPHIEEMLKAFHAFVGNSILVGHNAAFDMRFVRIKEGRANVHFRGPALDTLGLSRYLHDHTPEHSLDAVAKRLGVEVRDRHTALGDSLITAQVFIKLLYLLKTRGITTLGRALEVSRQ